MAGGAPPQCRHRSAPRWPTSVSVPLLHRMSVADPAEASLADGSGRKLRQLADLPASILKGVGSGAAHELGELGIDSVLDLLTHYPRRYIDGTRLAPLVELAIGDTASVLAEVRRVNRPPARHGRGRGRSPARVELDVTDGAGGVKGGFFNQTWRAQARGRWTPGP